MKKLIILGVVAFGATLFTSCGQSANVSMKTDVDSVSYAIGLDLGKMAFGFDTTLNVDLICAGVKDVYSKTTKMEQEQAMSVIGQYVTVGRGKKNETAGAEFLAKAEKESGAVKTQSGLIYTVQEAGSNDIKPVKGDTVTAHYILYDVAGKVLQSSYEAGKPITVPLVGLDQQGVIEGWVEGLQLIGKGGKATLYIPWNLAYGENGPMGPKTSLKFEVELVDVKKANAQ